MRSGRRRNDTCAALRRNATAQRTRADATPRNRGVARCRLRDPLANCRDAARDAGRYRPCRAAPGGVPKWCHAFRLRRRYRAPFADGIFNGIVCFGLLHHLSGKDPHAALAEMRRVASPRGAVVVFDNVNPRSTLRRPLAALLRMRDLGKHVRHAAEFRHLPIGHGFSVGPRITYAWTGLEGCWATLIRPPASADKKATG